MLLVASGAVQAQVAMKPGLWETRMVRMTVDGKDMLSQMSAAQEQMRQSLAKMPPEQRKKMEAMMAGQGGDMMTQRICISPEMAAKDGAMAPPRAECGPPKITKSGNRSTFEMACKQENGGQVVSKGETQLNGDQMNAKMEAVATEPRGARRVTQTETQMKFVSSDCGNIKPVDQLMSEIKARTGAMTGTAPAKK